MESFDYKTYAQHRGVFKILSNIDDGAFCENI